MKVCIIGGGLSGLICGKILSEKGFDVKIIEAKNDLGGLARCFSIDGFKIPVFYHHIFSHDKITLKVLKELGINEFYKKKIRMGISFNDKIYEISWLKAPFWDFLNLLDKLKFGLLAIRTKIKKDWKELEGLNAERWLLKTVGKNVTEKIFMPLMREKYGLPLNEISASELAERLSEEEAIGTFLYPKVGLYKMIERLRKKVEKYGEIVIGSAVRKVKFGSKTEVNYGRRKEKTDIVVNSSPVPVFLKISRNLPKSYTEKLEKIKYCKNICVDIIYDEMISNFYWINVFDKSFGGIIEHTNLAGMYPFRFAWLWKYAPSQNLWNMKDEKIARLFVNDLKKLFPHLSVKDYYVFRDPFASPLYDINYKKYMPSVKTPLKNLFFTGVAITYPEIRTMNTAFKSGIKTAETILKEFS